MAKTGKPCGKMRTKREKVSGLLRSLPTVSDLMAVISLTAAHDGKKVPEM